MVSKSYPVGKVFLVRLFPESFGAIVHVAVLGRCYHQWLVLLLVDALIDRIESKGKANEWSVVVKNELVVNMDG